MNLHLSDLGPPYSVVVSPARLPEPQRLIANDSLAAELDLPAELWHGQEATAIYAGNQPWPGQAARATVYAGHQFGRYMRQLGDGRALLIAELDTPIGAVELQLKGAGPTPYARGADGRAVLRSSIREYLASEAMHALGVPTTRALALVGSPLPVQRERSETAAVLCRVAPSFLRFGHFEYYARNGQAERVALLAHHVIERHHAHLLDVADPLERQALWLTEVVERQARLIAMWQTLGFCHGVMNTDNASILGLTLDYGPFGFIERFRVHQVCNESDIEGRYAYQAQPGIGQWNCARLLEACSGLLHAQPGIAAERARSILAAYQRTYDAEVMQRWRAKLGLQSARDGDAALINRLLMLMQASRCDFTLTFRALGREDRVHMRQRFREPAAFDAWWADWQQRAAVEGASLLQQRERMQRVNPAVVLRQHLAQAAVDAAEQGDKTELLALARVLQRPFEEPAEGSRYAEPAAAGQVTPELSCSS